MPCTYQQQANDIFNGMEEVLMELNRANIKPQYDLDTIEGIDKQIAFNIRKRYLLSGSGRPGMTSMRKGGMRVVQGIPQFCNNRHGQETKPVDNKHDREKFINLYLENVKLRALRRKMV